MRKSLATISVVIGCAVVVIPAEPEVRYSPDAILELVAADLATVPDARYTRYLSLDDLPDERARTDWELVMRGHLMTLSSEPGLAMPVRVGPLLRINTLDYGDTFAEEWERLGKVEPFWHGDDVSVENVYEDVPYGHYTDSNGVDYPPPRRNKGDRWTTTRTVRELVKKAGKSIRALFIRTEAGKKAIEAINIRTRGTDVPVVRATWFLSQTAISWQRDPGYYEFTGIKDLKTFEQSIGFVRKGQSAGFLRDVRGATGKSGVTLPDVLRRVVRLQAPAGGYWFTQDSDQRLHQKDEETRRLANPLAELGDDYVFDAVETIGYGPNGWPKTGLFDAKGAKQDRAPDNIAADDGGLFHDKRIHVNLSCAGCHLNGYLQDVDEWVRGDLNPDGLLGTKDERKARDLRSQYRDQYIDPYLARDRANYTLVVNQTVKMKPDAWARLYYDAFRQASVQDVSPEYAARQLGVSREKMREGFLKAAESLDITLKPMVGPNGRALPVVVWQGAFQRAADAVHGTRRAYKVRSRE